jgi:predicted dehydrogenase
MKKIGLALWGINGHQIQNSFFTNPDVELIGYGEIPVENMPEQFHELKKYNTFDEILNDDNVTMVSLCSAYRSQQAELAILAMRAGKHVYAEKPCALNEVDLDALITVSKETGMIFREMAGSGYEQPYYAMHGIVQGGGIGEIIQVFAQKSYPWHANRPQDENIDGGLTCQVAIHAVRMVTQVTNLKVVDVSNCVETKNGNPVKDGECRIASSITVLLENGAIATIIANYLNQTGFGSWGNEALRIFGTKGMIEATDGGTKSRLVLGDKDMGSLDTSSPQYNWYNLFVDCVNGKDNFPMKLEDELHPTRIVIRAKAMAK